MRLKWILAAAVLLIPAVMPSSTWAREDVPEDAPHLEVLEELTERLGLSEAQSSEVEPVLQEQHAARQAAFERHDINPRASRSAPRPSRRELFALASDLMPIREKANAAMADILTADQMEEWQAYQLERFNQLQRRLRGRR